MIFIVSGPCFQTGNQMKWFSALYLYTMVLVLAYCYVLFFLESDLSCYQNSKRTCFYQPFRSLRFVFIYFILLSMNYIKTVSTNPSFHTIDNECTSVKLMMYSISFFTMGKLEYFMINVIIKYIRLRESPQYRRSSYSTGHRPLPGTDIFI